MKSTSGWNSPNVGATNSSGFSALGGGYRGKKEILKGLKEVQGVDFKLIATQIDEEFGSTGQTQAQMDFD